MQDVWIIASGGPCEIGTIPSNDKYIVVQSESAQPLVARVNAMTHHGWRLEGGIAVADRLFIQAMSRP
jgi:hypothetical protein